MVVMVAVGSWSLGHVSTVGIIYVFYGINLFFGINIYAGIKSIHPVRPGPIKFILFINIPYRPKSIDGIVKNKLPGKLFFFSIMKQFLCIVRTYFVPRGIVIYHYLVRQWLVLCRFLSGRTPDTQLARCKLVK